MYKQALSLAAFLALAACSGNTSNPVNGPVADEDVAVPDDEGTTTEIPAELALNVNDVTFVEGDPNDPSDDLLLIDGLPGDSSPAEEANGTTAGTYARETSLDVPGFQAYLNQVDPARRVYVAVSATSADGAVRATSASDGGLNNIFFRGNHYERLVPLTRPATTDPDGQVSYAGYYAGVTNLDDLQQSIPLEAEPGTDPGTLPSQPRQTQGTVFLNVDFTDNSVEGRIENRQFSRDNKPLPDLALAVPQDNANNLDDNGEFTGTVEFLGRPDLGAQGTYGGIVGGTEASAVAGVVALDNLFSDQSDQDNSTFDREVGSFVLPRCGTASADPDLCNGIGD